MKESIAQAFILNLILFFFVILVLLLFGSINYSKAYKAKNRIITIIEKYGTFNSNAQDEIEENLARAGYQTTTNNQGCYDIASKESNGHVVFPTTNSNAVRQYHYCVIEHDGTIENSKYYQVVTYMEFDIPIIGGLLEFPVRGETKVLYNNLGN